MKLLRLARPVDVGHLNDHVDRHQTVSLPGPINTDCVRIIYLPVTPANTLVSQSINQSIKTHLQAKPKSGATLFTACNFRNVDQIGTKFGTDQRYLILNITPQLV